MESAWKYDVALSHLSPLSVNALSLDIKNSIKTVFKQLRIGGLAIYNS